jgi:hypothetical protein
MDLVQIPFVRKSDSSVRVNRMSWREYPCSLFESLDQGVGDENTLFLDNIEQLAIETHWSA